jgi:hypothetical protein
MANVSGDREPDHIDGSNEYYANHVIGIGDRVVFIGAIDMVNLVGNHEGEDFSSLHIILRITSRHWTSVVSFMRLSERLPAKCHCQMSYGRQKQLRITITSKHYISKLFSKVCTPTGILQHRYTNCKVKTLIEMDVEI